jgi:hypothetical protein
MKLWIIILMYSVATCAAHYGFAVEGKDIFQFSKTYTIVNVILIFKSIE